MQLRYQIVKCTHYSDIWPRSSGLMNHFSVRLNVFQPFVFVIDSVMLLLAFVIGAGDI